MNETETGQESLRREATAADRGSICLNLKKAARATSQVLDEFFQPLGIRASQFSVLNHLSILGSPTMTELAEASVTDRTTLTRNLGPLERDGLIAIATGKDRRIRRIMLTQSGRELLAKALPLREKAEECIMRELGESAWSDLLSHLGRLTQVSRDK